MRLMLVHRGDLRTEFSTPQGFDAIGLQLWADEHAERELGVSERSLLAKAERFLGRAMRDATVMDSPLDAVVAAEPVATGGTISEFGTLFERIHDLGTIDMVLVGSGHPSNVASFEWFISKVYLPYLAPVGRSLFIAGSACAALQKHSHRGLVLLGRCKSIEPLLRASITCPLPVIAGSGAPIKTIPALALNGAVTVTEHIERAFLLSSYGIPHFSEPKAFADDIRGLLTDVGKREARVGAARRYAEEKLSLSGYVEFWRERLT
jgi:hypothetical protein